MDRRQENKTRSKTVRVNGEIHLTLAAFLVHHHGGVRFLD
jgi:hypothetical protein